jgi:hypothetical protein
LDKRKGGLATNLDFSHVGNVEQARAIPHSEMLGKDAGVFEGHFPSAKAHQARTKPLMGGMERGFAEWYGGW